MTKSKYEIDMTNGDISRKLLRLVLPLVLSLFLEQMFSTADQIVVGRLVSNTALAAVGSTGPLIELLINISYGLATGITVACAKHKGENDTEKVRRCVGMGTLVSVIMGVSVLLIGQALCVPLLRMTSTPESIIDFSELYMRVVFIGVPFQMIYSFGSGMLRANGDTRRPMYLLFAGGIINILLNVALVLMLPEELGDKRVIGVAVGTAASHLFTSVGVIVMLVRGNGAFKLIAGKMRIYKEHFSEMIRVGIPNGLTGCAFTLAAILVQKRINSFGAEAISAFVISANLYNYICHVISGFRVGITPFVSQNVGAGKIKRVVEVTRKSIFAAVVCATALGALMALFARPLLGIFTTDADTLSYGVSIMRIICLSFVIFAPGDVLLGSFNGIDRSFIAMVTEMIMICGVRILWIMLLFPLWPTVPMLSLAYTVSWVFTSSSMTFLFVKEIKKLKGSFGLSSGDIGKTNDSEAD